ncbi:MAG: type II toxin-antitoxin system VapC family toxin [Planctomycetes bacterium]|nr:type II toxin-antitoxin system VapC family toxin [Planctomycetota bacterium]
MAGDLLLDTNIAIAYLAGEETVVRRLLETEAVYLPTIVVGELFFGANKSARVEENRLNVIRMLDWMRIPMFDISTAEVYGKIKFELKIKGTPIPENDLWIAATARQHGLTLISRDKHFRAIENLAVSSW